MKMDHEEVAKLLATIGLIARESDVFEAARTCRARELRWNFTPKA
jgi:hypothetical protein